jgi:hypothetical protein
MEGLIALVLIVAVLALLDVLAIRFGVDSRPTCLDDWSRSVAR